MYTKTILAAVGACSVAVIIAAPVLADTTTATITIAGGSLSISVPTTAGNLGTLTNTVLGGTISGPLGVVVVSDARSAAAGSGWVATVISTAFTPRPGPLSPRAQSATAPERSPRSGRRHTPRTTQET